MKKKKVVILGLVILMLMTLSGCSIVKRVTYKVTSEISGALQSYASQEYRKSAEKMMGDIELPEDAERAGGCIL